MAQNRIQFQQGLSLPAFMARYGTEAQCEAALEQARWPDGFRCPRCGERAHCVLHSSRRKRFQCNACRHQTSLTAGGSTMTGSDQGNPRKIGRKQLG